jgi:predicted oxidoreductase
MNTITIGTSDLRASEVSLGCMRIAGLDAASADALIGAAWDAGIDFYDHADIYGGGKSEEVFAASVERLGLDRSRLILQSKCGIRQGFFDFSKRHILTSVEGILGRLRTDYLDILLLHRPDALVEPAEVADAFDELAGSGKVRAFGVSNHNPGQIELLQASLPMRLHVNQLQFSVAHSGMVAAGLNVNMRNDNGINRDGGVLDYCRLKGITVQPWSPFQHGFFAGPFIGSPDFADLNKVMGEIADSHGVSPTTVAIAWILRHPARMQPVVGTTRPERVREAARASDIALTREEWYAIYRAAGNVLP